MSTNVKKK